MLAPFSSLEESLFTLLAGPKAYSLFHGSVSTYNKKIFILERYSVVLGVCLMNSFASCFALTVGENKENAMFVDGITGLGKCLPIFWEYLVILFSSCSIFSLLCVFFLSTWLQ